MTNKQSDDVRPRARLEEITPELATRWLELNSSNRKVVQSRVEEIARDMLTGRFLVTGEAIKFDFNGTLIDGQHRLWACVEAGVPFESYVIRGLDDAVKVVLDTGKKRTLGDWLQIRGESDAALLAGIVNIVWRYEADKWALNIAPTHTEATAWVEQHPLIRSAPRIAAMGRRGLAAAPSPVGAAYYLNACVDHEAAEEFWTAVYTGEGLKAGDPVLALRRWSVTTLSKRDKPRQRTQLGFFLRAMNLWREGRSVRMLHWRSDDGLPDTWSK